VSLIPFWEPPLFWHHFLDEKAILGGANMLYSDHALQSVPRHERLCRFCKARVESPEHALLECQANPDVLHLRNIFLEKLVRTIPKMQRNIIDLNSIALLKVIIYERSTIVLLGKFVREVLKIFYAIPVFRR
jgi:hypothetical protein